MDTKKKLRLGDMLVKGGMITEEQLKQALEKQKGSGKRLGRILMSLGWINEEMLLDFLSSQLGIPRINLIEIDQLDPNAIKLIPEFIVRRHTLIPIKRTLKEVVIAMSDPLDILAIDDIRVMIGDLEVKPAIAPETQIVEAIDKYYGREAFIDGIFKEEEAKEEGFVSKWAVEEKQMGVLEVEDDRSPIANVVNHILIEAIKVGASDIHIEPYEQELRVRYRIDGILYTVASPPTKMSSGIASRLKLMSHLDIAERRLPQDGRAKVNLRGKEIDLRVSITPTAFGEKVVLRILDPSSLCLDLSKLGFEPEVMDIYQEKIKSPNGIILITGPTGSGKTTTLYSTLSTINSPDKNIMTAEDPVEYVLKGINQQQIRSDIGLTFALALRSFLRQDPDIILVGEIRDVETAQVAVNAALTGHLVFASLHTNDAPGAITRLLNMGVEPFLISSTIIMSVAQRLLRVVCPKCKESYQVPAHSLADFGIESTEDMITLYRGAGCRYCNNIGLKGRSGIYEVMVMNEELEEAVINREPPHRLKDIAMRSGMKSLKQMAAQKALAGIIPIEEMLRLVV
ncbi:MAG: ATPase, T2SS/T4P/T4SS family [bacterium]|nr:ATPase, T2SS/T4P/T4SS family [bacterium]